MRCQRCGNKDPRFFYHGSGGWYCRKCIGFGRAMLEEEGEPVSLEPVKEEAFEYTMKYPLTKQQARISAACARIVQRSDTLLDCCTGAGKTELVLASISLFLRKGKKVCFAIPRRQVVLELAERLQEYFDHAKVVAVCGGHTQETDGDLIVCTTHQLYRYYQAFDLLILDEPDAFPFRGDPVLHGIADSSCRGHRVYLTATPDEELKKRVREGTLYCLRLNQRPHGHPLPVPLIRTGPVVYLLFRLVEWILKWKDSPRMVFVPTISIAKKMYRFLSLCDDCRICTSLTPDKDAAILSFRKEGKGVMVATTVLERGLTIPGVMVAVYKADHSVFDEASLVQMAGRAGRTFAYPEGDVLFLCESVSEEVERCRKSLIEANRTCV